MTSWPSRPRRLTEGFKLSRTPRLPRIRRLAEKAANRRAELSAAIDGARHLFKKPKSQLLHGVRVGLQKGVGKLTWASAERVVGLIKRHRRATAHVLIKTTETPVRKALSQLPVSELKKLGVNVEEAGDEVMIKIADTDTDKFVQALMDEQQERGD